MLPNLECRGHGDPQRGSRKKRRSGSKGPLIIMGFVFASVFASALVLIGWLMAPARRSDLWLEVAKAGAQLFVVVLIGGGIAATYKYLETEREDRRRVDEYIRSVRRELLEAYNRIKAVRRTLRAYGFRSPESGVLTAEQVAEFEAQVHLLVEAQLSLEKIARETKSDTQVFGSHGGRIYHFIHKAESYVNQVVRDWEKHPLAIVVGGFAHPATTQMTHLQAFLDSATIGFKANVSEPVEEVERLIGGQLLGSSRSQHSDKANEESDPHPVWADEARPPHDA